MAALLLIIPLLVALVAGQADVQPAEDTAPVVHAMTVPSVGAAIPPPRARTRESGPEAHAAGLEHLAAGRLPMAAHYFQQAARLGHQPGESYAALAYTYYRMDNPALGDEFRDKALASGAQPGDRWMTSALGERDAMTARKREMDALVSRLSARTPAGPLAATPAAMAPPPKPAAQPRVETIALSDKSAALSGDAPADQSAAAPVSEAPPAQAEDPGPSPGEVVGARGCAVLISASDSLSGQGAAAAKVLGRLGTSVDCLAAVPMPAPERTVVWYRSGHAEEARLIAGRLPGGADLRPASVLMNAVEVNLGRSFAQL